MKVNAFITHKKAEHFSDCQDRFSVNCDTKSIALSDGMGSTWQQKIWAHILAETFTKSKEKIFNQDNIKDLSDLWVGSVTEFIDKLKSENAPQNIIYRNERNLASGRSAGATFVGVRLVDNRWKGNVLGDSCLIVWNGKNADFFTSQNTDEFDSFPDYFDSNKESQGKGTPKDIDFEVKENEIILLVSDPFSDFLLERKKEGVIEQYISKLLNLNSHDEFENLVEEWRNSGMHNDDTTLIVVKYDSNSFNLEEGVVDDIDELIEKEDIESKSQDENKQKSQEEAEIKENTQSRTCNKEELFDTENTSNLSISESSAICCDDDRLISEVKEKFLKDDTLFKDFTVLHEKNIFNKLIEKFVSILKSELDNYMIKKK